MAIRVALRLVLWYNCGMNVGRGKSNTKRGRAKKAGEIFLYFAVPLLLVLAGALPSVALLILPVVLPLLYLLYRRFGPYLPLSCVVFYGILSLTLNYDILTVIFSVALFFAFCGLVISMQFNNSQYLLCATVAVCFAVVGAFAGVGIVRGAEGKPIGDIAANYVLEKQSDPIVAFFARDYYDAQKKPTPGKDKLKPGDEGYAEEAQQSLSEWAKDEYDTYIWYYCIHYGAVIALVGFIVAAGLNNKVNGKGNSVFNSRLGDMKLPRAYLWTMALPATVTGVALSLVGGYGALSATVMHTFTSIPAAFGCYTLLGYFAALFSGKARIAAYIILTVIGIAAVVLPFVLFLLSILGVCDCILNLRFWTEYIRKY